MKKPEDDDAGCSGTPSKHAKAGDEAEDASEDLDSAISHENQPVMTPVFKDPETENEKVIMVAALPGGAKEVEFSLIGTGAGTSYGKITYSWPQIMYDPVALFASSIKKKLLEQYHPKILAVKNDLPNHRISIDAIPRAVMTVKFPIPVITAEDSIIRSGVQLDDGTMVMMVELMAYQNSYAIKKKDTKVSFEKL